MDASLLVILSQLLQCDFALSRLHDVANLLDSSEFDSFYHDIQYLRSFISSICDKYSKN